MSREITPELFQQMDPENDEELNDILKPWIAETETFGTVLKHPLLFSIPMFPGQNKLHNIQFEKKLEMLEDYAKDENWLGYILTYERPYRLYGFGIAAGDIHDDETYWHVLGHIWTDSENIWQEEEQWLEYLSDERPGREHLMDEDEREAFESLPDTLTIHRGYKQDDRKMGMSWTLEVKMAEWFAARLAHHDEDDPRVVSGTIDKAKAIAYFTGRNEQEIVAFPDDITVTADYKVAARPKTGGDELLEAGNSPKQT